MQEGNAQNHEAPRIKMPPPQKKKNPNLNFFQKGGGGRTPKVNIF